MRETTTQVKQHSATRSARGQTQESSHKLKHRGRQYCPLSLSLASVLDLPLPPSNSSLATRADSTIRFVRFILRSRPRRLWECELFLFIGGHQAKNSCVCVCAYVLERGNEKGKCAKCLHLAGHGLLPLSNKTSLDFTLAMGRVASNNLPPQHPSQHRKSQAIII